MARTLVTSDYLKGEAKTKQHKRGRTLAWANHAIPVHNTGPLFLSHTAHPQMHGIIYVLFFSSLVLISFPTQAICDSTYRLKEVVAPPRGWIKLFKPPSSHTIRLRIGLPQLKFAELEKQLFEISDPNHYKYGKHLSKAEVEALVAPHRDSVEMVDEWLESFGIPRSHVARSPANDWITLNISLSLAEEMLNTVSLDRYIEWYTHVCIVYWSTRHILFGSMFPAATISFELRATASLLTSTAISTSFNPRPFLAGSTPRNL